MNTYIALLRGINVSGQKMIKMADLKIQLEGLQFSNIRTYIQSGNITFSFEKYSLAELENLIHTRILDHFGFEVPVIVRTTENLNRVVSNNPFDVQAKEDPKRVLVTFLSTLPSEDRITALREVDYSPEQWVLKGSDIYFFAPNGYGKAKMNNNFFESKLKVNATTRNWKTVNILAQMSKDQ